MRSLEGRVEVGVEQAAQDLEPGARPGEMSGWEAGGQGRTIGCIETPPGVRDSVAVAPSLCTVGSLRHLVLLCLVSISLRSRWSRY